MNKKLIVSIAFFFIPVIALASSPDGKELWKLLETGQFSGITALMQAMPAGEKKYWQSRIYFYQGDYGKARQEIEPLMLPDGTSTEINVLFYTYKALEDINSTAQEFSSEHFRMRARGQDIVLAPYALEALEKAYKEIGGDLNYFPEEKILVEVYPDKKEFSLASTLSDEILEKSGTVGICKFNRLMILSPQALPLGYSWLDTLTHEYTHFLVNRRSAAECPLWLHEGIAKYLDTRWRLAEPDYIQAAARNLLIAARKNDAFISFERMSPSLVYLKNQDEISLAFAEVSTAIHFLKDKYGIESVWKLLVELGALRDEKKAFKKALGLSPQKFEKLWTVFVKALPLEESPGAMNEQPQFKQKSDEEFIGASQRGQVRLGDEMRKIDRPEAAAFHYEKALKNEPANPVILLKLAKVHLQTGKPEKAEQELSTAIEKNPGYVTPYQLLGELHVKSGEYRKAADTLAKAITINPFHPQTHYLLSRCYIALGEMENARIELDASVVLDPNDSESKVILERLGR